MTQVKVFGIDKKLNPIKEKLSETIHSSIMDILGMPADKRAHRFFPMAAENMYYPGGRTDAYTILELTMITGRSEATRKKLIRTLFDRIRDEIGISHMDLEICIYESPAANWGFRGQHGDEIKLTYDIEV